jgi:inhibitor of KinA sporulation pathway (predicted exonuclease)
MIMKKSNKIIIASVVILGISGSVLAFGAKNHCENMTMQEKADMFNYHISRKLDLTTEQEIKLESLSSHLTEVLQPMKQQREDRASVIEQMLGEGPMDQSAVLQKITQKTDMVNRQAPEMVALIAQFVDSLDSGQKTELKKMIEKKGGYQGFAGHLGHRHDHSLWIDG